MTDVALQREKINQAIQILDELQLDCWLTFVRETGEQPDPALKLIFDQELTWHCAFILTRTGEKIAIVARYDDDLVKQGKLYDTVITYTDSFASVLVETLTRLNPSSIALNYSIDDVAADGLTHGMYLQLVEALKATPFPERFTSSSPLISRLRSRKTSQELVRMRQAIEETYGLFDLITRSLKAGVTEREISDLVHTEMASRSLGSAWSYDSCPGVKFGPNTLFGHGAPGGIEIEPGFVASVDLGVSYADYCSDLQRMWYLRKPGEQNVPEVVSQAFAAVKGAIEAGKAILKPGVQGWQVDAAAREYLVQAGYPEYQHALGHGVGRYAHDGGPILGPPWARYGETPYYTIEEGLIFTLELGVMTECGYVSQEDEVIVTAQGCEWFSQPQDAIYVV
ncbi:M24 family metallopeptidase [Ktedonobacter robiniae]|uniref:Peptidase M24 n=1 Tax=Ktedonobacter robiniae TaxID=2778365 RepID=A0ABQ3URD5_9CHLR|nr:Xaa-Pro peptidase family protein [Ktedonobacter robiniae]GHO55284.1 peptidase M24 [Ktedonobacter robiniae]